MGAIRQKRNHPTTNAGKPLKQALRRPRHIHWTPEKQTDLLHMDDGRAPPDRNEAAHLRLPTGYSTAKTVPPVRPLSSQTTHGCAGYTTLGGFAHTPLRLNCRALHQRYVFAAGQADTPPKINDALNKAIHAMTKALIHEANIRNDLRSSMHKAVSQATKEPQPYVYVSLSCSMRLRKSFRYGPILSTQGNVRRR
jgi:hypothetical protein